MDAGAALGFRPCSWIGLGISGKRRNEAVSVRYGVGQERRPKGVSFCGTTIYGTPSRSKSMEPNFSCSCMISKDSSVRPEGFNFAVDEALILQRKSKEVLPHLNGRCIYLVGMMGSGKTTVGKILAEVLGYSFFDSDKLVEQSVGMSSVAQIFKERSEAFFRDSESEVLQDLSLMQRLVVATGGGAVIRPINWKYMRHGVTCWLDVPLEVLARRIAAVGTDSRPLLHEESGNPYTKAFTRLTTLAEQRGDSYANADARACLQYIASKQGHDDVSYLTPTAIAIEALVRIETFLNQSVNTTGHAYNLQA